jgi:hypothetical protein
VAAGRLTGTLYFRPPHDSIGAITTFSRHATLSRSDADCKLASTPQPSFTSSTPCPSGAMVATGQSSPTTDLMGIIARRDPNSDHATINVVNHYGKQPYVWHTIHAVVPANHVQIASDFSSIDLRGGRGTFLRGSAHAKQSGPPTPWTATAGCPPDNSGGVSMQAPEGNFTGDFTTDFFLGRDRSVADVTVAATAWRDMPAS